ncbi:MAG: trypsin-like peptidase domain-containing protein [Verrucomicrobia bacterium]|nr:trypsin-like peptidase domain-containing protein [Verrucomicrobiota bacterium]
MTLQEAFAACPGLDRKGISGLIGGLTGRDYLQLFPDGYFPQRLTVGVNNGRVVAIQFDLGYPAPSRETMTKTVAWLLAAFGPPDTAFDATDIHPRKFGLVWKRKDVGAACWFDGTDSHKFIYAYVKIVPSTTDMETVLSSRKVRELTNTTPAILTALDEWSQSVAQLKSDAPPVVLVVPPQFRPTPIEKYELLIGEGLSGSGFVIRHTNALFGVCSLHQFDGKTPNRFESLGGKAVQLDSRRVFKQRDIQVLPVTDPTPIQFLEYNPDFILQAGEQLLALGPTGDVVRATLNASVMGKGSYKSAEGVRVLYARTTKPFVAAGGSGGPVIQRTTGRVVGVLVSADDPKRAQVFGFQTLCLPK